MPDRAKRLPLPKRFSVAMTEDAYARLRALNAEWGYGNNYLLTILLEHFDEVVDAEAYARVMAAFEADYGRPAPGGMGRPKS